MTVAVSENYNSLCGVGYRCGWCTHRDPNLGFYTWADLFNSTDPTGTAPWANDDYSTGWRFKIEDVPYNELCRGFIIWDTSLLPTNIAIQWAKIVGQAKFDPNASADGQGLARVMDVTYFVYGAGTATTCDTLDESDYAVLKTTAVLAGVIVTPAMLTYTSFEAPLNSAGLSAIVKGGLTRMGIRHAADIVNAPGEYTYYYAKFKDIYLNIAYEDEGTLVVITIPATNIASDAMTINGEITQGIATTRGFDWGISDCANPDAADLTSNWTEGGSFGAGAYSYDISGLTPGSCYCHRARAEE